MMEDKIRGTNDWPQVLTRGLVPRHVINQARRHVSAGEGPGWVTREGDGILPQICSVVCVLTAPK